MPASLSQVSRGHGQKAINKQSGEDNIESKMSTEKHIAFPATGIDL